MHSENSLGRRQNVEMLYYPPSSHRCTRQVLAHGVCGNCGKVAFQCRKCRHININYLDAFLCVVINLQLLIYYLDFLGYKHGSHLSRPLMLMPSQPGVEHVPRAAFFSAIAFLRAAVASGFW
jgi:hypothetical protein